jgi:hypothetical protein
MELIAKDKGAQKAGNESMVFDIRSPDLAACTVAYADFSSQVWLTVYPNHSSNDSSQRASKPRSRLGAPSACTNATYRSTIKCGREDHEEII